MTTSKPRVLVLGSGFGAFSFIKKIDTDYFDVTVVSPRNHFIFTPLLPSTTVGTIEFRSIIEPIRGARKNLSYYEAFAIGLNPEERIVRCRGAQESTEFTIGYDALVIAVGGTVNTFGIPGVRKHALFLKEVSDARAIRQRIIECFERASQPTISTEERKRLLHFVVIGGGPTGVEFAAEMHDFLVEDLKRLYPNCADELRISLFEAGDALLSSFDATLSAYTAKLFRRQNIEVHTGALVTSVDEKHITLDDGKEIPSGLVVWSTGIAPTEFVVALDLPKDNAQRLLTDDYLLIQGSTTIVALGDCANVAERNLPATSQVAQQQGHYLARALKRRFTNKPVRPFAYRHYGMLAYVGSNRALADLAGVKGKGFSTWLFWRSAYLTKLVSRKNKLLVIFDWFKAMVFGRDISRF